MATMDMAKAAAGSVDWKAKAKEGGSYAMDKATEAYTAVSRGDVATQTLCFAGGCALLTHAILNLINIFNVIAVFDYIFNLYVALFGFLMFMYERPGTCNYFGAEDKMKEFHKWTDVWFKIFSSLIGRGFMYVMFGILCYGHAGGIFSAGGIIGLYVIFCGVLLLFWNWKVGKQWKDKVEELEKSGVKPSAYKSSFTAKGMTKPEFAHFMDEKLSIKLEGELLNTAFRYMDKDHKGTVTFDEFETSFSEASTGYGTNA